MWLLLGLLFVIMFEYIYVLNKYYTHIRDVMANKRSSTEDDVVDQISSNEDDVVDQSSSTEDSATNEYSNDDHED